MSHFYFFKKKTGCTVIKSILMLFIGCYCFNTNLKAQATFDWALHFTGNMYAYQTSVATDNQGNIYTTGYFLDTVDFDPGPDTFYLFSHEPANWGYDLFMTKVNALGELVWAKSIGGASVIEGHSITVDKDGNLYVTGHFSDTIDFDPGQGTVKLHSAEESGQDAFIAKYDNQGELVWARSIGGDRSTFGKGVRVDSDGNVYTTGYFSGTADFNLQGSTAQTLTAPGTQPDIFVLKLDHAGSFVWARSLGGNGRDEAYGIGIDTADNIYIGGYFTGTDVFFNPGASPVPVSAFSAGNTDILVAKISPAGNLLWAGGMGSRTAADFCYALTVDKQGNVYTTGYFQLTADFDPGVDSFKITSDNNTTPFISKLDTDGEFVFATALQGTSFDQGLGIAVDDSGYIYTTGFFQGRMDLDPGTDSFMINSSGNRTIFISKLDATGNFVWGQRLGGTIGSDYGYSRSITVDRWSNVYTAGDFGGRFDFDSGPDSFILAGRQFTIGTFLHKTMQNCSEASTVTVTECDSFSFNGQSYTSTGIYADTLKNIVGCDSIVTIDLTINSTPDRSVTKNGNTLTATGTGSYQWVDCDDQDTDIPGATNREFTPSASGNYAVVVTSDQGCSGRSVCTEVIIFPESVPDISRDILLQVIPNPAQDEISISTNGMNGETATLSLISITGQTLRTMEASGAAAIRMDISGLAPGVYFIGLNSEGRVLKSRFIKH